MASVSMSVLQDTNKIPITPVSHVAGHAPKVRKQLYLYLVKLSVANMMNVIARLTIKTGFLSLSRLKTCYAKLAMVALIDIPKDGL